MAEKAPNIRFDDSPENWKQRKFKEIFDLLGNNSLSRAELNYDSGIVQNVHYGDILTQLSQLENRC